MKKIAIIPIDNRPICYSLIKDILAQDDGIEVFLPERRYLGGLSTSADIKHLYKFVENLPEVDYFVISLDTIAYGGLVSSRRCSASFDEIKNNLLRFKNLIQKKKAKVLAFSSIMRISNNNINEEEKEYWAQWGKRIFEFSYHQHKSRKNKSYNCVYNQIPQDILDDYLTTRKRNFEINRLYFDWLDDKTLDTLVFSKDDTGEYGLNVEEAELLQKEINERALNALVKTGADEIPLTLLARALCEDKNLKIRPIYLNPDSTNKISKYEDISVKNCVQSQLELAKCSVVSEGSDLDFLINNFEDSQGDLVLGDLINIYSKPLKLPQKPYFIADINNANGADDGFVYQMLDCGLNPNLYGYCGYNTSANSIGCAILSAVTKFFAQKNGTFSEKAFKKLSFIRLLDDWAYQANVRKFIRESAPHFTCALNEKLPQLKEFENKIAEFLGYNYKEVKYSLPWERSFEVEINVKDI